MDALRLTYVDGATPAKWIRHWDARHVGDALLHERVPEARQLDAVRSGEADVAIVRLPIDEAGLHVVRLYEEQAVAVVPREHPAAAFDALTLADLEGEPMLDGAGLTPEQLVEVVATGAGIAIMPMSLARLHAVPDVRSRPLTDAPTTRVALVWRRERDDERIQELVGIVRGRTARSSRGSDVAGEQAPPGQASVAAARDRRTAKAATSRRTQRPRRR